jgi:nucleoside phosphorylase
MPPLPIEDYHVGIICALHTELAAARAMLDEEYGHITKKDKNDHNTYFTGRMHQHHVVIACLPGGVDGIAAAATVAKDMSRTFTELRIGLLVGVGGAIPHLDKGVDIRLGDVVVSQPSGTSGGVVQYDLGKSTTGEVFERKGMLNVPPTVLLTALQSLKAEYELEESRMSTYLNQMLERRPKMRSNGYASPGPEKDVLYLLGTEHAQGMATCENCDPQGQVSRSLRTTCTPHIHYGVIASGNQVIKSSAVRDQLRQAYGVLCVEMEAAGLMNNFPCLVIRGICDYADSHKNDEWHKYAACTAAAYAKELLLHVSAEQTRHEESITQILGK